MSKPSFTKKVIGMVNDDVPNAVFNALSVVGDINGDGFDDVVIGAVNGKLVWFENKGEIGEWKMHIIDDQVTNLECGGSLVDLTGNGLPDLICGNNAGGDGVYWWENTGRPDEKWTKRLIIKTGHMQIHDTIVGDITGDGKKALIFTNQRTGKGTRIYYIPIPEDPTVSPWPDVQIIAEGKSEPNPYSPAGFQPEEGLAIGDVDGDGVNELICGTHWYKYNGKGWDGYKFASGYLTCKCAVGDVDGDGRNEIVLSEGDPVIYGKTQGGKLAWFKPKGDITEMWEEHVLEDNLLDAHSLQLGDICGNGKVDIFVGEIGVADKQREYKIRLPRLLVFENDGKGNFTRYVIDEGTGTHEAMLADTRKRGVLDIVGKPLHDAEIWNVHVWYNNLAK